jgi:RluA family pseudouridine synthase
LTLPDILYEDDQLAAFDKPAGLPVAAGRRGGAGATLMGLVRARFGASISNVHRLDDEASGVVLCAKTKQALDFLSGQFQSKTVRKVFDALCVVGEAPAQAGTAARGPSGALPPEFSVDLAVGEDEADPARMRVFRRRGGRPSSTAFRVLEDFGRFVLLECRPLSGRPHQVRVHLAAAGAPVLNDATYGDPGARLLLSGLKRGYKGRAEEKPLMSALALHACALGFTHPSTREEVEIAAPLPADFGIALKYLRRFAGRRPGL